MKRNIAIDSTCGLMIIYMIFGHMLLFNPQIKEQSQDLQTVLSYMLFYFMPWFFFKAGQFFKRKPLHEVITDSFKRLLIPFFVFSIIGHLLYCLNLYLHGDGNLIHYTFSFIKAILFGGVSQGNQPIWFLLSLFIVRIIFSYLIEKKKSVYIIVLVALGLSCLLHQLISYRVPLWGTTFGVPEYIVNSSSGLFFYAIGVILKDKQYLGGVIVASVVTYIAIAISDFSFVDFRTDTLVQGHYLVHKLDSVAGIVIVNNVFKFLHNFYKFPVMSYIGRRSMYFLILHFPLMTLTLLLYSGRGITLFVLEIFVLAIVIPVIVYFARKKQWLCIFFGEKYIPSERM